MTDTRFVFNPASDESVDDEYVMIGHPNVTIQVAPYMGRLGKYGVNEWLPDEQAMQDHGHFPTLKAAQAKAIAIAAVRS